MCWFGESVVIRAPNSADRFRNDTERTGGLNPFNGLGSTNSLSLLRDKPVQGQRVPGLGRRMNSGVIGFNGLA